MKCEPEAGRYPPEPSASPLAEKSNMKKTIAVCLLVTGFIVGWGTASVIAHRNIEKIKQGWSPDFQRIVAENVEFTKGLTNADMEQLRKDIRDYKNHSVKELEIETLWQAILASQIQRALANGDTNLVRDILTARIDKLKQAQAEGRFKGTDWEKNVETLISKTEGGSNAPTTGRTVPPSAGASGVQ